VNDPARLWSGITDVEVDHLATRAHADPHRVLGAHPVADAVAVRLADGRALPLERIDPTGLWAAWTTASVAPGSYRVETTRADVSWSTREPWNFLPTVGPLDEHLFGEGRHWRLHERLGAHPQTLDGIPGVAFAVWAPNAGLRRRRLEPLGPRHAPAPPPRRPRPLGNLRP
jgi:1,4-alpha-glucan branching enzyme